MKKKCEVVVNLQQDFTASEQAQGRNNIGAASASDMTALQSQVSSLSDVSAYSVKGEATVAQLNAGPSGIQAGWAYQLTDSGTLTDGSLAVVAGDTVAWDGTKWFPLVKSDYYATKTYAQNVAHSIAPEYEETTYKANSYVIHNGILYTNPNEIETAEAWNPAHWVQTTIAVMAGGVTEAGTIDISTGTANVRNNANSEAAISTATATFVCSPEEDFACNFAIKITASVDSTISVLKSTPEYKTTLGHSDAGGNTVTAGKTYQLTCVGDFWTLEECNAPAITVNIGGRYYPVKRIGNQLWITENLDFKFDGCSIGAEDSPNTSAAWYYDNDESTYGVNGNKYGLLYNWFAVNYINNNLSELGIPAGWHVATSAEWDALTSAVGGTSIAGTKLKSATGWTSGAGTDDYGFAVLPTGLRYSGSFYNLGSRASFWTATEASSTAAYNRNFDTGASLSLGDYNKTSNAFSVRLVKDA